MSTVVFSGGVGAARFLSGLVQVIDPKEITVISNTGDDTVFHGLYVSPDIDIVIYTLCGMVNPETGWGLKDDSFVALKELGKLGCDTWFNLGDRDLATHIFRSMLLSQGVLLSQVTQRLAEVRGLACKIIPMSDERVETVFETDAGPLAFQEYMVKHRWQKQIRKIIFRGAEDAKPAPGVIEAILQAERIIIAPSNPLISIGTILSVPGIREALRQTTAAVAAISPIVGGAAIKGPAAVLMESFGYDVSPVGVAECYRDFVNLMVIDRLDKARLLEIQAMGVDAISTDTMMTSPQRKMELARTVLERIS